MTAHLTGLLQDALGSDYRIEQELEGGGMSRLFLTTDLRHNRRVVVKVLSPELVSTQSTARFKREIELTVRLQHPHILPILTSGAWDDVLYYITPFIPGESLRERIARDRKLPLDDIVKILRDVSGALAFAHQRGIVHRDVKPGNILLAEGHAILADFGIARAVATNATPLTGSGMTPGTPAYMAPELPTDEKADVYALGVVAYEMLCGELPKRGVTAKEIVARRGKVSGDSRASLARIAELAASAMRQDAASRTASADDLRGGLETLSIGRVSRPAVWVTAAALAALVGGAVWWKQRSAPLNADHLVVTALASPNAGTPSMVPALVDALAEWQGITAVDGATRLSSVKRSSPDGAVPVGVALSIARAERAGGLVSVESREAADSIEVRATLYDVRGDSAIKTSHVTMRRNADPAQQRSALRRLANGIIRDGAELPWQDASDQARPSIVAWRWYDQGRSALRRWQLDSARVAFTHAAEEEQRAPLIQLWLGQTLYWLNGRRDAEQVRAGTRQALASPTKLGEVDSLHAAGLLALSADDYGAACNAFNRMLARDSTQLSAWIGLGDCQAGNHTVLRDARAPGGWRFESSYESAARAYQRANEIGSGDRTSQFQGWLLGRLSAVLYPITNKLRLGRSPLPDTTNFAAYETLSSDTLASVPIPIADLNKAGAGPEFSTIQAAVARNRNTLRRLAEDWVRRSPTSPAAYDSLASWTEVSGGVATVGERLTSTLDVVRRAFDLSRDSTQRLRLSVMSVRLLLKDGKFAAARTTADSLLRVGAARRVSDIPDIAGLPALLGRVEEAARLLPNAGTDRRIHLAGGTIDTLPPQVFESASRLLVYASSAASGDSVRAIASRTIALINSYYPSPDHAAQVRGTVVIDPLTSAYPDGAELLRGDDRPADALSRAYQALARHDSASARAQFAAQHKLASSRQQGTAFDVNLRRARLALALGDTVAALTELDPVLRALPLLGPSLLAQIPQVTALVRALALRAELAAARSDTTTTRECASAVVALWGNADASLQPLVSRMKQLAGNRS